LIDDTGAQRERAWFEFWLPVISGLGQQCSHPSIEIRHQAIAFLQRILLSEELAAAADKSHETKKRVDIFDIVLFPMFQDLCQVDVLADIIGNAETNLRVCVMTTKVLLQFASILASNNDFDRLWITILDYMSKMVGLLQDQRMIHVQEGIVESVKNMILVLISDKILIFSNENESLWCSTWDRVDKLDPRIKIELQLHQKREQPQEEPKPEI
jgi:hypothetical protein